MDEGSFLGTFCTLQSSETVCLSSQYLKDSSATARGIQLHLQGLKKNISIIEDSKTHLFFPVKGWSGLVVDGLDVALGQIQYCSGAICEC